MFIAKPVLFILFILSIGSTAGLLFLLSQRTPSAPLSPSATNTVMVSPSSVASSTPFINASASPSTQLSSSAEWKTATSSALKVKLDYPADWTLSGIDSENLKITTPSSSVEISVRRDKKESVSAKLVGFVSTREQAYKKDSFIVKDDTSTSVDDYSGNERLYIKDNESVREIIFSTKNYFYIIVVTPGQGDASPVVTDIVKSIRIQ